MAESPTRLGGLLDARRVYSCKVNNKHLSHDTCVAATQFSRSHECKCKRRGFEHARAFARTFDAQLQSTCNRSGDDDNDDACGAPSGAAVALSCSCVLLANVVETLSVSVTYPVDLAR